MDTRSNNGCILKSINLITFHITTVDAFLDWKFIFKSKQPKVDSKIIKLQNKSQKKKIVHKYDIFFKHDNITSNLRIIQSQIQLNGKHKKVI